MREIRLRYTFKRRDDGHLWQLIIPIESLEERSGQIHSMLANEDWELIARDEFTGLRDKNGVEIYEGDVLRIKYSDGQYFDAIVRWFAGDTHNTNGEYGMETATWVLKKYAAEGKDCLTEMFHLACEDVREIIGNVHENPELLK